MSETHYNEPAELASQSSSPGELLKRERENQGLSREEVASALNLRPAVVDGLESDRYDEIPVAAYRRGYLRAYARLLGIDETPVIAAYKSHFGGVENEHKVTPVHVTKPPSRLGAWLFKLVTLLVIAGLIGLTLLWWQSRDGNDLLGLGGSEPVAVDTLDGTTITGDADDTTDSSESAESVTETLPPLPDDSDDMGLVDEAPPEPIGDIAVDSGSVDAPVSPRADEGATTDAPSAPADTAPVEESSVDERVALEAEPGEPEAGPDEATEESTAAPEADSRTLELTFNEQSWTEIFDANDERIFVGLQESGTQATAEGDPPFRLTIGNATGVELQYRGESIDLGARAGSNNVARFTLGE